MEITSVFSIQPRRQFAQGMFHLKRLDAEQNDLRPGDGVFPAFHRPNVQLRFKQFPALKRDISGDDFARLDCSCRNDSPRDRLRHDPRADDRQLRQAIVGYRSTGPPMASCTERGAVTIRFPLRYAIDAVPPLSRQIFGPDHGFDQLDQLIRLVVRGFALGAVLAVGQRARSAAASAAGYLGRSTADAG